MKAILLSIFVFSFSLLGAEPKVVGFDKLQKRGKAGSQLTYIPNQDTPFTGKAVSFYSNGQKKQEKNYKDDKLDGLWTSWYENWEKKQEKNYKDNERDGLWTNWYENGQKAGEESYKDGKLMSAVRWKSNGEKCPETNVKDGNGVQIVYYKNGQKWKKTNYKDGKPHGLWTSWREDGLKEVELRWKDGERVD